MNVIRSIDDLDIDEASVSEKAQSLIDSVSSIQEAVDDSSTKRDKEPLPKTAAFKFTAIISDAKDR